MAKRKRLKPAILEANQAGLESKLSQATRAPIASVAQDASATAALQELSDEMRCARSEGRMLLQLPLAVVDEAHLVRDRLTNDDQDMAALKDSLKRRGQQTAIEVVDLGGGRYGLISGWRRLAALRDLGISETVLAIVRQPSDSAEAYLAMVEENEVRAGLSYFERARIVAQAAEQGVYPDPRAALSGLFASASRAKRSKIGSFLKVVEGLDGALRFPAAIGERLGLALAKALEIEPNFAQKASDVLAASAPDSPEAEGTLLASLLKVKPRSKVAGKPSVIKQMPSGLTVSERKGELVLGGDLLKDARVRAALLATLERFKP